MKCQEGLLGQLSSRSRCSLWWLFTKGSRTFPGSPEQKGPEAAASSRGMVQSLLCNYYINDCEVFALIRDLTRWSGWQLASFYAGVWYLALFIKVCMKCPGGKSHLAGCWCSRSSSLSPALAHTSSCPCLHVLRSPYSSGDPILQPWKSPVTGGIQILKCWKELISSFNTKT